MTRALALAICFLLFANLPAAAAATRRAGEFQSGGKKVLVEIYEPAEAGKHPAVILLHGSAGVLFPGLELRKRGLQLAEGGYPTFLVHYFDRTGHVMVTRAQVHENLDTWRAVIQESISYAARQPGVDAGRITLMGHSLGAYLALATALHDDRVKAIIEASGALDEPGIKRLPPTLVLHGARDKTVPITKAYRLEAFLRRSETPYRIHIYPEEAHIYSRAAMADASQRIDAFLARYFPANQG